MVVEDTIGSDEEAYDAKTDDEDESMLMDMPLGKIEVL